MGAGVINSLPFRWRNRERMGQMKGRENKVSPYPLAEEGTVE
jgi:hypothetical protein